MLTENVIFRSTKLLFTASKILCATMSYWDARETVDVILDKIGHRLQHPALDQAKRWR
jgi:hypothetical protein